MLPCVPVLCSLYPNDLQPNILMCFSTQLWFPKGIFPTGFSITFLTRDPYRAISDACLVLTIILTTYIKFLETHPKYIYNLLHSLVWLYFMLWCSSKRLFIILFLFFQNDLYCYIDAIKNVLQWNTRHYNITHNVLVVTRK